MADSAAAEEEEEIYDILELAAKRRKDEENARFAAEAAKYSRMQADQRDRVEQERIARQEAIEKHER